MEQIKTYVAYYRVSTKRQGESGLGLDGQQTMVKNFIKDGELIAEFTEVESGKNTRKSKRYDLLAAIEVCKRTNSTLVIAKLDRLSRDVSFTASLLSSGLDFIVCDMPQANKLTIHIIAAIAEYEREMTSYRTIAALSELKKRGVKLGKDDNFNQQGRNKGTRTRVKESRLDDKNRQAKELIAVYIKQGLSDAQIATKLNGLGFKTIRDKGYKHGTIYALRKVLSDKNIYLDERKIEIDGKVEAAMAKYDALHATPAHTTKPAKPTKKKA